MPQPLPPSSPFGVLVPLGVNAIGPPANKKMLSAERLVHDLSNPDLQENALLELSKVYPHTSIEDLDELSSLHLGPFHGRDCEPWL